MQTCGRSYYTTAWGQGAVSVSEHGVKRVWLPGEADGADVELDESLLSKRAAQQLEHYFQGDLQTFDLPLDIASLTSFRQRVLQQACRIPYGTVTTYGALAQAIGAPAAARAVGGALAANPIPLIIPCHRVVAVSGDLTGFSAVGGISMKKFLLSLEHVDMSTIDRSQKVQVMNNIFFATK